MTAMTKARHPDWRKLNINVHVTVMEMFQRLADKRHMNVTDTVRRAGMVLDKLEKIEDTPNQAIAVVTLDPKTRKVVEVNELVLIIG